MSYASPPNLWEYPSLLYRTKSFELNRYYIEHPVVHGLADAAPGLGMRRLRHARCRT